VAANNTLTLPTTANGSLVALDSSGRLGIGTASPEATLAVIGTPGSTVFQPGTPAGGIQHIVFDNATLYAVAFTGATNPITQYAVGTQSNIPYSFLTNNTERARIDTSGRLLVGTSTSLDSTALIQTYKASGEVRIRAISDSLANGEESLIRATGGTRNAILSVYKHSGISNPCAYLLLQQENGTNPYIWTDNSGNLRISATASHVGTTSGTVVGTQTSDERLKNIHGPVQYGLETIEQLEPVRFAFKSDPSREQLGFIAQQVLPLVPQAVFDTDEVIKEGEPTKLGMEYVALIPVLVNAIKELSAKVAALETP
jgi:hypothetical protein